MGKVTHGQNWGPKWNLDQPLNGDGYNKNTVWLKKRNDDMSKEHGSHGPAASPELFSKLGLPAKGSAAYSPAALAAPAGRDGRTVFGTGSDGPDRYTPDSR